MKRVRIPVKVRPNLMAPVGTLGMVRNAPLVDSLSGYATYLIAPDEPSIEIGLRFTQGSTWQRLIASVKSFRIEM